MLAGGGGLGMGGAEGGWIMQSNILKHIIFQFIFKHLAGIVHPRPTPSPQIVAIDPDFKKSVF